MRLKDKVAAITGAGSGIGRSAAELFAREGAKVAILEINAEVGRETENAIRSAGGEGVVIRTDISDADSVAGAFAEIEKVLGRVEVLYNNASIFLGDDDKPVTELSTETWRRVLECNLYGLFHCCKYGIALMRKSGGGSVITTSSSAGVIGVPGNDAYTASKGATISLTRSMAVEFGPENIRVNCIAPAAIKTPMVAQSNLNNDSFDEEDFLRRAPLRRWGKPEEIANLALFLASDESSYLNGTIIRADGAGTIRPFF